MLKRCGVASPPFLGKLELKSTSHIQVQDIPVCVFNLQHRLYRLEKTKLQYLFDLSRHHGATEIQIASFHLQLALFHSHSPSHYTETISASSIYYFPLILGFYNKHEVHHNRLYRLHRIRSPQPMPSEPIHHIHHCSFPPSTPRRNNQQKPQAPRPSQERFQFLLRRRHRTALRSRCLYLVSPHDRF